MTVPPSEKPETLDATVRRADPDRWLASRFIADSAARADVMALYAFNDELARIAPAVSNPLLGEIRLAWWREAIDEMTGAGSVRRHPVAEALARAVAARRLDAALLYGMVEARAADLDTAPFADAVELYSYLDATAGALMALAAQALGAADPIAAVQSAGRAWGVAGLARSHWLTGSPSRLPPDWTAADVSAAVDSLLITSRSALKALPVSAFPTVAYAAFARAYARRRALSDLGKRGRLVAAAVSGKL